MKTTKLTAHHVETLCRIRHSLSDSALPAEYRTVRGHNIRTLRLLARIGLVDVKATRGPRGGRKRGVALTAAGRDVVYRAEMIVEGLSFDPFVCYDDRRYVWRT